MVQDYFSGFFQFKNHTEQSRKTWNMHTDTKIINTKPVKYSTMQNSEHRIFSESYTNWSIRITIVAESELYKIKAHILSCIEVIINLGLTNGFHTNKGIQIPELRWQPNPQIGIHSEHFHTHDQNLTSAWKYMPQRWVIGYKMTKFNLIMNGKWKNHQI